MSLRWTLSQDGIDFIKWWETGDGRPQLRAYDDGQGVMTIGYGHAIRKGDDFGLVISAQKAEELLIEDLESAEVAVNRAVKVELKQHQYDALVSFTYNLGGYNLRRSTLLKMLNASDYAAVPAQLARWCKDDIDRDGVTEAHEVVLGLKRRREAEGRVWTLGDYSGRP